jgi:hypothetical protein
MKKIMFALLLSAKFVQAQNLVSFVNKTTGKYGLKDKKGNIIITPKYDDIWSEENSSRIWLEVDNQWGFLDSKGLEVLSPRYYFSPNDIYAGKIRRKGMFKGGYSRACIEAKDVGVVIKGGKWGFIDSTFKEVVPFKYDAVNFFSDGLAAVNIGGEYYHYDVDYGFRGGKWGFIDNTGKVVIPIVYDDNESGYWFENGKAKVKLNDREFYIDKNGNEIK